MSAEFLTITVILALLAALLVGVPLWRHRTGAAGIVGFALIVIVLPLAVLSLYTQTTTYPWENPELLTAQPPGAQSPGEVLEMVAELEARMASEPTVEGLAMLGRSYQVLQRYEDAVATYHRAWEMTAGEDPRISISYAEALIFADQDSILTSAGDLIEDALPKAPNDPRALWYGGLSALARGDTRIGQQRWVKLLNNPDIPDQLRQVVQSQLASLNAAGDIGPDQPPGPVLNVSIDIAPELAAQASTVGALFVFARDASKTGGAPLAVRRLADGRLPLTLKLTDDDAMVPGSSLADAADLIVTARISQSGKADAASGDLYGSARVAVQGDSMDVSVRIDSRIE